MKFVPMEPIVIFTVNGGNALAIEPVRERTEWIGKYHASPRVNLEELKKFLDEHFAKTGESRAT